MKKLLSIFILSVFLAPSLGMAASGATIANPRVKILLVPGHDEEVWGAQYGSIKEATMTLSLATRIYNILKKDKRFEVYITRDSKGYVKEFSGYFTNKDDINAFKENAKKETQSKIESGEFKERESVPHNAVSADTAVVLYGINKWANENKMDAVIHVHFNDYPRPSKWTIGKHKGFAVYFPDSELENWMESSQLAADIFTQLRKKYATSTYGKELGGLVPDQKLIALGSNGTLLKSVRSVLVEYGYIYEKKFRTSSPRIQAYNSMANLTTTGIKKYFFPK
ncbi:MAG TPA: N-acetylmuramoyl-L-alanine amidase [Candidatus Paceibacterota bacterium]